ncbi:DoxX family protein [Flagellimonas pelagia]|uniref:DoxX family protein n=1 Tax=Flagellimonas pelagia TaxID=2306998 RepID=A0A3A1NC17_9FLAO|nr:DoxX family protein [Allomuricauda maritima]RIV41945.1 DoxX family protein [Allomuricauda maritima]TXJ90822.1 DoxX family protein [Allomuricauda maritima]
MMRKVLMRFLSTDITGKVVHIALLALRTLASLELIVVHGFKKIGIGVAIPEKVPNPLGLPEQLNEFLAIASNLGFPILIIFGFLTRLATVPVLVVTLTGYWVVHAHDPLLVKDVPFMYSLVYLFIFVVGPGKYALDTVLFTKLNR